MCLIIGSNRLRRGIIFSGNAWLIPLDGVRKADTTVDWEVATTWCEDVIANGVREIIVPVGCENTFTDKKTHYSLLN